MGRQRGQVGRTECAIVDPDGFAELVAEIAHVFAASRTATKGPAGGLRELARVSGLRLATLSEWTRKAPTRRPRVGVSRATFGRLEMALLEAAQRSDADRFADWFGRLAAALSWPADGKGPWPAAPDVRAVQRQRWQRRNAAPALLETLLPAVALEQLRRGRFSRQLETHWPADRRALATPRDADALQRHLPLLVGVEDGVVDHPNGPRVLVHLRDPAE
jgi:hypothetical protein